MTKKLSIKDKSVLITGAGNGIGLALVKETLHRGGFPVAVDIEEEALTSLRTLIGDRGLVFHADVCGTTAMAQVVQKTCDHFGGLDIVIANAGIERIDPIEDMPDATFESVIETNFLGVYRTIKPAIPIIRKRKGHIVAVSSIAALVPFPLASAYSTSKAAVNMFIRTLRMELNGRPASAGVCFFGFVETGMSNRIFEQSLVKRAINRFHAPLLGTKPVISAETAAIKILDGVERRKARTYAPSMVRVTYWFQGLYALFDDLAAKHTMRRGNLLYQLKMQKKHQISNQEDPK